MHNTLLASLFVLCLGATVLAQGSLRILILGSGGEPPPIGTETLTVTLAGDGSGTVTSSPSGINCGVDCTEVYTVNTEVTLIPTPDGGSGFAGWSGNADCADSLVTMSASFTCTATFDTDPPTPPAGIEGYGAVTAGCDSAASPSTVQVTNLNASGAGSFRQAMLDIDGNGTCIEFTVSGEITLQAGLTINYGFWTLDCNTSSSGITISNNDVYDLSVSSSVRDVTDIIIRGCTWHGESTTNDDDGFIWRFHRVNGNDLSRVIVEHNTFYQGGDGMVETWNGNTVNDGPADFTVQGNIFLDSELAMGQGYGTRRWTVHRNLYTDNSWRQPLLGGGGDNGGTQDYDFVNNIVWGWGCLTGFGQGTQISTSLTAVTDIKIIKNIYATKSGCSSSQEGAIHYNTGPPHANFRIRYDSNDMPAGETQDVNIGTVPNTPSSAQTTEVDTTDLCQAILVDDRVGPDNLTAEASAAVTAARSQFECL